MSGSPGQAAVTERFSWPVSVRSGQLSAAISHGQRVVMLESCTPRSAALGIAPAGNGVRAEPPALILPLRPRSPRLGTGWPGTARGFEEGSLGAPDVVAGPVSRVCAASEPGVARHLPVRQKESSKTTLDDGQRTGRVRPTPLIAAVKRLRARTEVCNRTTWAPLRLRRPRRHTRRALELPLTDVTTLRNPERTEVLQRRSRCVAARMAPRDARPTPAYYTPAIQEGAP